jgi:hypothetical protein
MVIQKTVDIPASCRLVIEVPHEIPAGRAILALTPLPAGDGGLPDEARGQSRNEAFRRALRRAYGAWTDKPWENAAEDINAMRYEWDRLDPWNPDSSKRHRD